MNNTESSADHVQVIAEVGSVHDGSFGNAMKLVEAAAQAGADVAKFQTHIASAETLRSAPMPPYFKGEPRYEYFERTAFSFEQWQQLKAHCESQGLAFLSSPFSVEAVALLERLGVTEYKVGSGEVTNIPMLKAIGRTNKRVLISSGMSTWQELDQAVATVREFHDQITVLQCSSEYPCAPQDVGLNIMVEMRERYDLPVGLSDHTLFEFAPLAAVALGASVIEKHLTFSRAMYGSDARHSMEPQAFAEMVRGIRDVTVMRSHRLDKDAKAAELRNMKEIFEKSVVSVADIKSGQTISSDMLAVKKPGTGIPARRLDEIIGRVAVCDIPRDTLLSEEMLRA